MGTLTGTIRLNPAGSNVLNITRTCDGTGTTSQNNTTCDQRWDGTTRTEILGMYTASPLRIEALQSGSGYIVRISGLQPRASNFSSYFINLTWDAVLVGTSLVAVPGSYKFTNNTPFPIPLEVREVRDSCDLRWTLTSGTGSLLGYSTTVSNDSGTKLTINNFSISQVPLSF